jgi:chloride channel 3/4/5
VIRCIQAPLTIQSNSPVELLHKFFVKLGARYVVVTDTDGYCELPLHSLIFFELSLMNADMGVIDKKTWLAFLSELEEKS